MDHEPGTGIPLEAYVYVLNGKNAIEWVMECHAVTTDKGSGIVDDASLWATETMNNALYSLELLLLVITVSLETMQVDNSLPKLEIERQLQELHKFRIFDLN